GDRGFHDVVYEALVADPLAEVERLYARLGLELSPLARRRMGAWVGRHHRRRASTHRYALADFGLDAGEVERRFARYRAWVAARRPSEAWASRVRTSPVTSRAKRSWSPPSVRSARPWGSAPSPSCLAASSARPSANGYSSSQATWTSRKKMSTPTSPMPLIC